MAINVTLQKITTAKVQSVPAGQYHAPFDSVDVLSNGATVSLYLPAGTGQAVVDAILAALATATGE